MSLNKLEKTMIGEGICIGLGLFLYYLGLNQCYNQQSMELKEILQNPMISIGILLTYSSFAGLLITGSVRDYRIKNNDFWSNSNL